MVLNRGILLNNRYRVVEILGQGGMGAVYRAVDENLGVDVALKENLFTTEEYARQFRREAVILASLRHPNLTRVTDHFVIEDQGQYLVMDYIEGEDLRQRMDRAGVFSEEEVITIGVAICDALSYLEGRNPPIVHRDIKPGNVKVTSNGQIFLVDFGLAKVIMSGQVTTTGARAMTPGYSPPEQYGTARTDQRSDLFSLGATLYAALTGAIPEDALARTMGQTDLTPMRKFNPRISRRLAAVIEKSLAVHPDDRYQSSDEMKQALLSVRAVVRRKTGEYTITPGPATPINPNVFLDTPASRTPTPAPANQPNEAPPFPLPASVPLADSPASPVKVGSKTGRGIGWLVAGLVILALTSVMVFLYDPSLPNQALALVMPSPTTEIQVVVIDIPTSTPTVRHTATIPPSLTPTDQVLTPLPPDTIAPSPSPSQPTPAAQPIVLPSPSVTPTPLGGASGLIAFASDRSGTTQIWIMNSSGGELQQLTDLSEGACQPNWSPDGMRLVFISPCDRNQDQYKNSGLFVINWDGTGLVPLPSVGGGDFDPVWSPDGNKIAFASLRVTGRPRIYLLDLNTKEVTRISGQYSYDWQPDWSPDGSQIAFVTAQKGAIQIWTMDATGGDEAIYTRSGDMINLHPEWSNDGSLILFTQLNQLGAVPRIVTASYTEDQYNEYRFDLGPTPIREARYSPDGLWLAFESWPAGDNHDIYIMASSGAGKLRLTDAPGFDFDPAWRPAPLSP